MGYVISDDNAYLYYLSKLSTLSFFLLALLASNCAFSTFFNMVKLITCSARNENKAAHFARQQETILIIQHNKYSFLYTQTM